MLPGTLNSVNLNSINGSNMISSGVSSNLSTTINNCNSHTSLDGMTIISSITSSSPLSSGIISSSMITGCPSPSLSTSSSCLSSTYDPLESLWPKEIDEFSNLALQACHQEVKRVSDNLGISPDPFTWTVNDVLSWLSWQVKQSGLPMFPLHYFQMDGMTLCSLSEQDFKNRALYCGDVLYAQLEIWKTLSEQSN